MYGIKKNRSLNTLSRLGGTPGIQYEPQIRQYVGVKELMGKAAVYSIIGMRGTILH